MVSHIDMKGIVLAGGTGSRLYPLTRVTNKHLLPVGKYPMIYHPIMRLRRAGIEELAIVTSPEHMGDVVNLLGSGTRFGVDLTYRVQDEPGGIAQAIALCENFTGQGPFTVVLGDNILSADFDEDARRYLADVDSCKSCARVLLKEVHDPERYGVPRFEDDRIVEVIEKPSDPPSSYSVVGIYFFDRGAYEVIRTLDPSARGELEISDVISAYAQNRCLTYGVIDGWWGDAGTLEGWHEANELAKELIYDELESSHAE